MSDSAFALDPRLDNDTRHVTSLDLCDVLLMNDARFPWLVLVPRQPGMVELCDLSPDDQAQLWREVTRASQALRSRDAFDKLNLGALGNIVRQLHVHVVGRREGDAAWPGPVWGSGAAVPYDEEVLASRLQVLRTALK
ncbi:HIT domain-containing protein [Dyella terrae]|uniref:HIT domain-containing protein n=1 Tax=Dyella terrae TaxID=522259 RepID=UPI001EFD79A2|nr:HIT family protein [Dyella terrae]ULU24316.1 HIT family protein [Dyella terrae]